MLDPTQRVTQEKKYKSNLKPQETDKENLGLPVKNSPTEKAKAKVVRFSGRSILGELSPKTLAGVNQSGVKINQLPPKTVVEKPKIPKDQAVESLDKKTVEGVLSSSLLRKPSSSPGYADTAAYFLQQVETLEKNIIQFEDAVRKSLSIYKNFNPDKFADLIDQYIIALFSYKSILEAKEKIENLDFVPEKKLETNFRDRLTDGLQTLKQLIFPNKVKILESQTATLKEIMELLQKRLNEILMEYLERNCEKISNQLILEESKTKFDKYPNIVKVQKDCGRILTMYQLLEDKGFPLSAVHQETRWAFKEIQQTLSLVEKINLISRKIDKNVSQFWSIPNHLIGSIGEMECLINNCRVLEVLYRHLVAATQKLHFSAIARNMAIPDTSQCYKNITFLRDSLRQKLEKFYEKSCEQVRRDLQEIESIPEPNVKKQNAIFKLYTYCQNLLRLEQLAGKQGIEVGSEDEVNYLKKIPQKLSTIFVDFDSSSLRKKWIISSPEKKLINTPTLLPASTLEQLEAPIILPTRQTTPLEKKTTVSKAKDVNPLDTEASDRLRFASHLPKKRFWEMAEHSGLDWKYSYESNLRRVLVEEETHSSNQPMNHDFR